MLQKAIDSEAAFFKRKKNDGKSLFSGIVNVRKIFDNTQVVMNIVDERFERFIF